MVRVASSWKSVYGCRALGVIFLVQQVYDIKNVITDVQVRTYASSSALVIEALSIGSAALLLYLGARYFSARSAEHSSLVSLALGVACLAAARVTSLITNGFLVEVTFRVIASGLFLIASGMFFGGQKR